MSDVVRAGANVMASSHEHLDAVPEYEEPTLPNAEESRAETAGAGIHAQKRIDATHDESTPLSSDQSSVASIDGAEDEQPSQEVTERASAGGPKNSGHSTDEAEWTEDESEDASSDATLLAAKQDGFFLRLWSQVQVKLVAFWQFISGGFQKAKSD